MGTKRVMIIDDDREFLEEVRVMLELSGYELVALNDESAAIRVAKETKPSVVVVDLKMPKKTGFQLATELRYISELADVPIIAMSAFYRDDYKSLLDMCNIKRCLRKPFQPLDLIAEVEAALSEYERGGS